jgi:SAM-dependent methyltransferase
VSVPDQLPTAFLRDLEALEAAYLTGTDPIRQSGFGGGPERWRQERSPLLDAVDADGTFLDVGCANGYLLECLVHWAAHRDIHLTPYGVDVGRRLIELARERLPAYANNFYVANAWGWDPPRRFRYVYTLHDSVPRAYLCDYVRRLVAGAVEAGGRFILGAYGSRSRGVAPFDVGGLLESIGYEVTGSSLAGDPPIARFAWVTVGAR